MPEHNIVPKTPEMVMEEFNNIPFSVPVGEGSFQGLACPNCRNERFSCKGCLEPWLRSAMQSLLQQAVVELEEKRDSVSWMETKKDMEILERVTIGDCITVIKSLSE